MRKAIAIDFDGCLCENAWPEIGKPHIEVINAAIKEKAGGSALILWTCRSGELMERAVDWCRSYGLEFDAVNENLLERLEHYGNESRKISADEYWDDLAVHMPTPPNDPLTLEELREMDGEPVWIETTDVKKANRWAFVDVGCGVVRFFDTRCGVKCSVMGNNFRTYGKTWLAYHLNPKEEQ